MMKNKTLTMKGVILTAFSLLCLHVVAQQDMTSRIKNPSFENGTTGWTQKNMAQQTNDAFGLKAGSKYLEKWTVRGNAVGSASLSQELTSLPAGKYELTVAAQNIQEDTPTSAQTGAYIFADDKTTTVTVRNTYTVAFTCITGSATIGFEAVNATGNWIALDNFRLALVSQDLSDELGAAIASAKQLYGSGTGNDASQLLTAINDAENTLQNTEADADAQAKAIIALEEAIDIYKRANASADSPLDMTDMITNPSFEIDGTTGWTNENMAVQGNNDFSIKNGSTYAEKWVAWGSAVGNAHISQTLTNMPSGRYQLKVAAQNIQQGSANTAQKGARIYANTHGADITVRKDYTLEFVLVSDQLEIGFKAEDATGNWIAVDNFRLLYISNGYDDIKNEFQDLIDKAEAMAKNHTNTTAHKSLQAAIAKARSAMQDNAGTEAWVEPARLLEAAYRTAETSLTVFTRLKAAIDEAIAIRDVQGDNGNAMSTYQAAIDAAQDVYDNGDSDDSAQAAIDALAKATFAFRVANGTGTVPTVATDSRFIRGATWAFGRSTVSGSNILEQGFCWSEQPNPTVTDSRTTEYMEQAGKIYWMRDLKPATVYYMRAYAITTGYAVGYGDVIKFATVPKGTITHGYNNGGDDATNDRINTAINTAIDYYWNNLTSIHDFGISVTYSAGIETADCSYGGNMRVGPKSSYQQAGTIMHEALHGIGVGTHNIWWSSEMRSDGNRGDWLGDRVTEAVRFWDNNNAAVITGDETHLWPYGCNGANEDTHNDNLYCMMGILAQALNEDGLPGSSKIGYALPYYAFTHDDDTKYYIKNEDEARGLLTACLVETDDHKLQWQEMTATQAQANDAAAWYLTFTPSNQYYQLRNAATGYYVTYASGFKTVKHTNPTSADNLHLMRGRVDVTMGEGYTDATPAYRGYYIIHPEASETPKVLTANTNGATTSTAFSIAKSATTQRWLILTADEMDDIENGAAKAIRNELTALIAQIRKVALTPHTELSAGADKKLDNELTAIANESEAIANGSQTNATDQLKTLIARANTAFTTFLGSVAAADREQPFDLSFMLQNPDFDTDATTGWTTAAEPGYGAGGVEFYQKGFNFYQTLSDMPAGDYLLCVQAFQRPGETDAAYTKYAAGTRDVTTMLYMGDATATIKHICDDKQPSALYNNGEWGSDKKLGDGTYVPNCMSGAAMYFEKGLYDNSVTWQNTTADATVSLGLRCTSADSYYWTMFDHFRLYYYGQDSTPVAIHDIQPADTEGQTSSPAAQWFSLDGRPYGATPTAKGIYVRRYTGQHTGHKVVQKRYR